MAKILVDLNDYIDDGKKNCISRQIYTNSEP